MRIRVAVFAHYALYFVLLLMLYAYVKLGARLYEITITYYTLHFRIFNEVFSVVFGFTLFTRLCISINCKHLKSTFVRVIILFVTTLVSIYVYRYCYFHSLFLFCAFLWTETVCEVLPWRMFKPPA